MKRVVKLTESDLARIVRRVIKEQEESSPVDKTEDTIPKVMELSQELGSNIDPKIANEVMSCTFNEIGSGLNLKPEAKELLDKVKAKIKEMVSNKDRNGLKNVFTQLKSKLSKTPPTQTEVDVNEQVGALAGTFALMGITAPVWAWVAVGAIVLILLIKAIVYLTSWIPKSKGHGCSRTVTYRVRR
jgi:hypothetical protein